MRAAAHDCVPCGAPEPQQPARAPSETDCPAARGPPRRIRATGAAEIEMTAPKRRSRAAVLRAPATLTHPQRAAGAGGALRRWESNLGLSVLNSMFIVAYEVF